MSLLLLLLYPIAVQYERGGLWRVFFPITLVTLVIDVIANYTELALLTWDFPQEGEYTFSDRLVRLKHNGDWRGVIARMAVGYCDIFFEGHIK